MLIVRAALLVLASCFAVAAHSQPPAPTPSKAGQQPENRSKQADAKSETPRKDGNQSVFSVTIDRPVTIQKSQEDRDAEATDIEQKSANERWLLIWNGVLAGTTLLVAAITGVLAWFTYGLWNEAKNASWRQAREMNDSLSIARQSADAAAKAAEMTEKSVKEMRQNARTELRAYVSATPAPVVLPTGKTRPDAVAIHCHNTGRTPAYEIRSHLTWYPTPPGTSSLPDDFAYPELGAHGADASTGTLGANQPIDFIFDDTDDFIGRARRGEIELFVYGHISYCLVFPKKDNGRMIEHTYFCYRYVNGGTSADGRAVHGFRMYRDHNDAT